MKRAHLSLAVLLLGIFFNGALPLNAHQYKFPLIIDTDMGLDDTRALVMLLNRDMADIRLIVATDGAVSPAAGHKNIKTLLSLFPRLKTSHITIAAGRDTGKKAPPWRQWSKDILDFGHPGTRGAKEKPVPAAQAIVDALKKRESPCVYLCLGPLTSLAAALEQDQNIKYNISRVIYYGTSPGSARVDWNTSRDPGAARKVFDSGLKIYTFSRGRVKPLTFGPVFFNKIKSLDTPASRILVKLHTHPAAAKLLAQNHFRIWDELTAIYMEQPGLFSFDHTGDNVSKISQYEPGKIYAAYLKMLGFYADGHLREREVVVLDSFPVKPKRFKADVAPHVKKIIEKHGLEEWKACVLTNELHRHLGTYSLIGAKMGIRAREILDAPLDSVRVISYAGSNPPLSCMNDGLQVSTGASLGRGTISIADGQKRPAACFIYKDKKIVLTLKESVVRQIKNDIAAAVKKYGGVTPEYFAHIRGLSIRYWYTLDRKEIFQ